MLDLPGGMRIGTIHAFCQSLLRRFPLEASLSPHFRLVDDRDAEDALTEARETCWRMPARRGMRAALDTLAGPRLGRPVRHATSRRCSAICRRLQRRARAWRELEAAQRRALGVTAATEAEIIAGRGELAGGTAAARRRAIVAATARRRAPNARHAFSTGSAWTRPERGEHWQHWCEEFLTKDGKPRAPSGFVSKAVRDAHPDLARSLPGRMRSDHRGDRRLPALRRGGGLGRAGDAGRAGAATPTRSARRRPGCSTTTT